MDGAIDEPRYKPDELVMNRSGVRFSKVARIGPVNRNDSCSRGLQLFLEGDAFGESVCSAPKTLLLSGILVVF